MPENRSSPPVKVTLEDLLHLKRSERPEPEFWTEFERTLRQRQLAALVVKKSWWHRLAVAHRRLGRVGLPLGAAAVLGFVFLSIRNESVQTAGVAATAGQAMPHPRVMTAAVPTRAVAATRPVRAEVIAHPRPVARPEVAARRPEVAADDAAGTPAQAAEPTRWVGEMLANHVNQAALTPSARSIAVNYAAVAAAEPQLVDSVDGPLTFDGRTLAAARPQHTAEVLPTAVAVTEARRARLLASLETSDASSREVATPDRARRNVLRYISQEGWDRSMGRLEAEGDKVSIRF